jgi:hypothetical protein
MLKIGDYVKVKDQDITGYIVEHSSGSRLIIEDDCSEYNAPDNRLEYSANDLELIGG